MRPKKKNDIRKKYTISEKQINKIKQDVTEQAVHMTGILYLVALSERGWGEDEIVELFEQISRYVNYVDDKLVKMKEVQEIVERKTGIKLNGKW